MQLSPATLDALKNFATINQGIVVEEGSQRLKTMSPSKTIFAKAQIDDEFPQEFAIYDLSEFLSTLSLFDVPDLKFDDERFVTIEEASENKQMVPSCHYHFASKNLVVYPEKDIESVPSKEVEFTFKQNDLARLQKAASTLGVPDMIVTRENDQLVVKVTDKGNDSSNDYKVPVGDYTGNEEDEFEFHFRMDNLKMMKGDYDVAISAKNIAHLTNNDLGVEYFIALEGTSYSNFEG